MARREAMPMRLRRRGCSSMVRGCDGLGSIAASHGGCRILTETRQPAMIPRPGAIRTHMIHRRPAEETEVLLGLGHFQQGGSRLERRRWLPPHHVECLGDRDHCRLATPSPLIPTRDEPSATARLCQTLYTRAARVGGAQPRLNLVGLEAGGRLPARAADEESGACVGRSRIGPHKARPDVKRVPGAQSGRSPPVGNTVPSTIAPTCASSRQQPPLPVASVPQLPPPSLEANPKPPQPPQAAAAR
eukprot:scaffold91036_cov27-Tisochrysis_lutea.AAC.8